MLKKSLFAGLAALTLAGAAKQEFDASPNFRIPPPDEASLKLPAGVPRKIQLTDKPADPQGKLVKLRYGPFTVPPNSIFNNLPVIAGGANITKPCVSCYIGKFQGGMEYEDGSEANIDTGMYMHHFVVINNNKPDWLCGVRAGSLLRSQWIYNSGNEHPPVRLNSKYKFGMKIDADDRFSALGELMNMSNETKTVYTTVIYEYVPLDTPGYREATHLRLDGWLCGGSDLPAKKGYYQYQMANWTSPYSGVVLHTDGHGHDGTTDVKLFQNGKLICDSTQYYGLRPGWVEKHQMDGGHSGMRYISDAVACEDEGRVEKGDVFHTIASYNDTEYPQMVFRNHLENQMSIHFLYIGRDENTLKDRLKLQPLGDQLPREFNYSSLRLRMSPTPSNFTTPDLVSYITQLNVTDMLRKYNVDPSLAKGILGPILPPDFDFADPFASIPFSPPNLQKIGATMATFGIPNPFAPKQTGQSLSLGSGVPSWLANFVPPEKLSGITPSTDLSTVIPGLPKDTRLEKIFVPGGIITSEMDEVVDSWYKSKGTKNPFGHTAVNRRELTRRTIAEWTDMRY